MTDLRGSCGQQSWIRSSAGMNRGKGRSNRALAFESTGWPLSVFPQRCLRGAKDIGVCAWRSPDRISRGANPGSSVDMTTHGRRRSALDDGGRVPGGSRPPVKLAACSLALLAFLSDPAAAFHPVLPPARRTRGDTRKSPRTHPPCQNHMDDLLQGSFSVRLGRQARRWPYSWAPGWVSCLPGRIAPFEAVPGGASGIGGEGGGGSGSGTGGSGSRARDSWGANRERLGRRGTEATRRSSAKGGWGRSARRGPSSSSSSLMPLSSTLGPSRREAHSMTDTPVRSAEDRSRSSETSEASLPPPPASSSSPRTIEAFPLIVEALSAFKRINGHLNVPPRFEVPMEAPWPEDLGGMELGKKISQLRGEMQTYMVQYPDRVQMLRSLGFEWDTAKLPDEWDIIRMGLEGYFRTYGHSRVPIKFVVPADSAWPEEVWGHKLGGRVLQMRQTGKYMGETVEEKEERAAILNAIGFNSAVQTYKDQGTGGEEDQDFDVLCEALEVYRSLGGFVPNMPQTFVVPDQDPWPLRTRQFPLGYEIRAIRSNQKYVKGNTERNQRLVALGVPLTPVLESRSPTDVRFDKIILGLERYKEIFGTVSVPLTFEVPREQPWPEFTWGTKLGRSLYNIANKGTFLAGYPERKARLEVLGFDTDPRGLRDNVAKNSKMDVVHNGAIVDGVEYGSVETLQPENLPGIDTDSIGKSTTEFDILRGNVGQEFSPRRSEDSLGSTAAGDVDFKLLDDFRRQRFGVGLGEDEEDAEEEDDDDGDMDILGADPARGRFMPQSQSLPIWKSNGTDADILALMSRDIHFFFRTNGVNLDYWPEESHHVVARKMIAKLGTYARGFNQVLDLEGPIGTKLVELPGVLSPEEMDPKSKKFRGRGVSDDEDYYGDFGLDDDNDDEEGDSAMIDREYGRRVMPGCSTAASGLDWCTEEDRQRVLEQNFDWQEFGDGFQWPQVAEALTMYKNMFEELPRENFVVPDDGEWPRELVGMQLGPFCRQIRIGDVWAKHGPERRQFLDDLGFDWGDDSVYLLFQWSEILITFYSVRRLKGHLDVPHDFVIPHEDPWPLPIQGYPVGYYLNVVRAQKDVLLEHYPERFSTLRGLGVAWIEPTFVDSDVEGKSNEYNYWEWGMGQLGAINEEDGIQSPSVNPDFGVHDLE